MLFLLFQPLYPLILQNFSIFGQLHQLKGGILIQGLHFILYGFNLLDFVFIFYSFFLKLLGSPPLINNTYLLVEYILKSVVH